MGRAIERIAAGRGHEITHRVTGETRASLRADELRDADAVIEFTRPDAAKENVLLCREAGVPVVCGTTGWADDLADVEQLISESARGALIHATNFSVGVQIFFALNRRLAELMSRRPEYGVHISETHHTEKKDAPSGTAITLAEGILAEVPRITRWEKGAAATAEELPIYSHREPGVPGTHKVVYASDVDTIEIQHTADNRDGFALGAVLAAEFIVGKTGVWTMQDVLGL